jgi:hypothetical protein
MGFPVKQRIESRNRVTNHRGESSFHRGTLRPRLLSVSERDMAEAGWHCMCWSDDAVLLTLAGQQICATAVGKTRVGGAQ